MLAGELYKPAKTTNECTQATNITLRVLLSFKIWLISTKKLHPTFPISNLQNSTQDHKIPTLHKLSNWIKINHRLFTLCLPADSAKNKQKKAGIEGAFALPFFPGKKLQFALFLRELFDSPG
jgi:hypothetical protein